MVTRRRPALFQVPSRLAPAAGRFLHRVSGAPLVQTVVRVSRTEPAPRKPAGRSTNSVVPAWARSRTSARAGIWPVGAESRLDCDRRPNPETAKVERCILHDARAVVAALASTLINTFSRPWSLGLDRPGDQRSSAAPPARSTVNGEPTAVGRGNRPSRVMRQIDVRLTPMRSRTSRNGIRRSVPCGCPLGAVNIRDTVTRSKLHCLAAAR